MNASSYAALAPHWLRPFWLLALLALPVLGWLWRRRARSATPWQRVVDPHLLSSLLQEAPASTQSSVWLAAAAYLLSVLALAGPSWHRQSIPLYAPAAPLVVALDMSSHMLATDLKPSRLLRARLKIEQLIAQRKGGQLGLVAYAGDAFTVAPLSDDAGSLRDLLAALAPDTMPVDGQRADRAIRRAVDLLAHAGFPQGRILLLSDGADADAQASARDALSKGATVDVIGVGTAAGAPLPSSDGTFPEDTNGAMQLARLDAAGLRALARAGGGGYQLLRSDTSDLSALGVLNSGTEATVHRSDADALRWRDDGPFLLLALLPLAALGFRRGWLVGVLLALLAVPAQRAEAAHTDGWNALWLRADQRADHALRAGDVAAAVRLAQTPAQRAAAAYRNRNYLAAARGWASLDTVDAHYDRGNALAQAKRYPEAIAAYQRALQLRPDMGDAKANLQLVRKLQQQEQQQQQDKKQQDHQSHAQTQQGQDQQNQQQQNQQQQSQQQQSQQQQNKQQQAGAKSQSPQRQDHQRQAQQRQAQQRQAQQWQDQQRQVQQQQPGQSDRGQHQPEPTTDQQPTPDPAKQAQSDAAELRAMQQALQHGKQRIGQRAPVPMQESNIQREKRQAIEALLQRVPDDPGGLLRRKFELEYARRQQGGGK